MQDLEKLYIRARIKDRPIIEPILELGVGWDQEFHRGPFRERGITQFYTQDIERFEGVDLDFTGDLCDTTDVPSGFAGTVLIFNTLEHVHAPWQAVVEVARVLKPGGLMLGSVPLRTALHRHSRDFWRLCPDGLAYLLRGFRMVHFAIDGNVAFPANLLFAAQADPAQSDWWDHNQKVVLNPEVIIGNDFTVRPGWRRTAIGFLQRRARRTIEHWYGPWDRRRMLELGYESWTVGRYE